MCKRFAKQESSGRSSRNSWMRSPGDEDRTPPELRPGSHSGHPVYSDSSRRNSGRTRHLPGTLPGHNVSSIKMGVEKDRNFFEFPAIYLVNE